jgi:hypothetical protein
MRTGTSVPSNKPKGSTSFLLLSPESIQALSYSHPPFLLQGKAHPSSLPLLPMAVKALTMGKWENNKTPLLTFIK